MINFLSKPGKFLIGEIAHRILQSFSNFESVKTRVAQELFNTEFIGRVNRTMI